MNYPLVMLWMRKSHGWVGLWGAILGLLFGFSGFWLNNRATLAPSQQRVRAQVMLPDPAPADIEQMSAWLQSRLKLKAPPNSTRVEPARPVGWAEKAIGPESGQAPPLTHLSQPTSRAAVKSLILLTPRA